MIAALSPICSSLKCVNNSLTNNGFIKMRQAGTQILVIEDDAVFRQTLVAYLAKDNVHIVEAEDGIEGLSAAAIYHPDLVFCDLNIPNMDGYEVIACLAARYPDIPVIVISAQKNLTAVARALRAGARDFLFKPLDDGAMLERSMARVLQKMGETTARLELIAYMGFFAEQDKAASRLLDGLKPPKLHEWGPWQITFKSQGHFFMSDVFRVNGKLLLLIMELPLLDRGMAFCGALVRSLMNVPYRQYQRKESELLAQPHRLLDYLNHQLMDSGLRHSFSMAALLFDEQDGLTYANAGLTSPHWLMRSGGLPLGLLRNSHHTLYRRSWHSPFELQFLSDAGSMLEMTVVYS